MNSKRILSMLCVILIMFTGSAFAKDYSDFPQKYWDLDKSHWAYAYISELTDKNVIQGYEDGSFKPNKTVTRAEWAKLLCVASGKNIESVKKAYAADYKSSDWFSKYVNTVKDYLNFYDMGGEVYFKPNQAITREDVTVSLVKLKGYDLSELDYSNITQFKDFNTISNSMKQYISVAIANGLIEGFDDGTFRPHDTLTRAEAAALLCRAFRLGDVNKNAEYGEYDGTAQKTDDTQSKEYYDDYYSGLLSSNDKEIENEETTESGYKKPDSVLEEKETEDVISSKQYIMKVLAQTDVDLCRYSIYDIGKLSTMDDNNNIYYIDKEKNSVFKISVDDETVTKYCEFNEVVMKASEKEGGSTVLVSSESVSARQIFYDTVNKKLILLLNDGEVYDITDNSYAKMFKISSSRASIQTAVNADIYISWHYDYRGYTVFYNISADFVKGISMSFNDCVSGVVCDNNLYGLSDRSIYQYDFGEDTKKAVVTDISDYKAFTIKDDSYYFLFNDNSLGKISVRNKKAEILPLKIDSENVDFIDFGNMKNIAGKFYVIDNDTMVFYDYNMKAFRKLYKNNN